MNNINISKPLSIEDFLEPNTKKNTKNNSSHQNNYIEKNQKNYGHRKRIKPWRTGTKSQQQITPKGFKKGFRK